MRMPTRNIYYAAVFVLALGILTWITLPPPAAPTPGVFFEAGYLVLIPYVDEQLPGVFDTVELKGQSVSLQSTCDFGDHERQEIRDRIMVKRTIDQTIDKKLLAGVDIDMNRLRSVGGFVLDGVQKVTVRYVNSSIWSLSTQSLMHLRRKFLTGDCEKAIASELKKGHQVCQAESVVVSDVRYEVTKHGGSKVVVKSLTELTLTEEESVQVEGEKMFHAVKLDELKAGCIILKEHQVVRGETQNPRRLENSRSIFSYLA